MWILFELAFTEDVDINTGVFNTTITRDFLADYSLGVYIDRYVQLSAEVNITVCDGVVCQAADQARTDFKLVN